MKSQHFCQGVTGANQWKFVSTSMYATQQAVAYRSRDEASQTRVIKEQRKWRKCATKKWIKRNSEWLSNVWKGIKHKGMITPREMKQVRQTKGRGSNKIWKMFSVRSLPKNKSNSARKRQNKSKIASDEQINFCRWQCKAAHMKFINNVTNGICRLFIHSHNQISCRPLNIVAFSEFIENIPVHSINKSDVTPALHVLWFNSFNRTTKNIQRSHLVLLILHLSCYPSW